MKSTRHNKAGHRWNEMNYTDRANWLQKSRAGNYSWAWESWCNLPESVRVAFISHLKIATAIYAYR